MSSVQVTLWIESASGPDRETKGVFLPHTKEEFLRVAGAMWDAREILVATTTGDAGGSR